MDALCLAGIFVIALLMAVLWGINLYIQNECKGILADLDKLEEKIKQISKKEE